MRYPKQSSKSYYATRQALNQSGTKKKKLRIQNSKFKIQNSKLDNVRPSVDVETKNTDTRDIEASKMLALLSNIHQHPGCLDFCLESIPIQP